MAAIDEYLNRTSTEGRSRVAAAMRRLEVRIGRLLGPPMTPQEKGGLRDVHRDEELAIHGQTKSDFRAMAEHPEVVEEVIAESTDEAPASRRKAVDKNPTNDPPHDPTSSPIRHRYETTHGGS